MRFYDNGYLQFDSPEGTFFAPFSRYDNFAIANNHLFETSSDGDVDNYTKDMFFFEFSNNSCLFQKDFSLVNSGFSSFDESYNFNGHFNDDNAIYIYRRETASELRIKIKTTNGYSDKGRALSALGLNEYDNCVATFSNSSESSSINFVFATDSTNIKSVTSVFLNKTKNNLISQIDFGFNDNVIIESTNVRAIGLSDDDLINNCVLLEEINSNKHPLEKEAAQSGLLLKNNNETSNYISILNEMNNEKVSYDLTITFLNNLDSNVFGNKNIVFSNMLFLGDSEVSYGFEKAYLKDGTLYLSFDKKSGDYAYQIVSYSTFVFQIDKGVSFNRIVSIF